MLLLSMRLSARDQRHQMPLQQARCDSLHQLMLEGLGQLLNESEARKGRQRGDDNTVTGSEADRIGPHMTGSTR